MEKTVTDFSKNVEVNSEVPQGCLLAPLLFNIDINKIADRIKIIDIYYSVPITE